MSWSFSVKATSPDEFLAALGAAEAVGNDTASAERDEQVIATKAAVTLLFDSPALGNAGNAQQGSLIGCIVSGHAQAAHILTGKPEDFGSENVVINLYRVVEEVPATEQPTASTAPEPSTPEPVETPEPASEVGETTPSMEPEPAPVTESEAGETGYGDGSTDIGLSGDDAGDDSEPTSEPAAESAPVVAGGLSQ
jgi:hypothetical protein